MKIRWQIQIVLYLSKQDFQIRFKILLGLCAGNVHMVQNIFRCICHAILFNLFYVVSWTEIFHDIWVVLTQGTLRHCNTLFLYSNLHNANATKFQKNRHPSQHNSLLIYPLPLHILKPPVQPAKRTKRFYIFPIDHHCPSMG